ncbi:MAG TPA: isoprenylcysteine carboxylmethyltransferase family protein [Acidobacteriaceae bacterium]|jgi:protein-S-isoprenylcysteine O-methyltransferase Ste14|nr:isoprenylcysteine carboxylmethyltransferase family protein [Acidobacteriaceae bacterium]
MKATQFEFRFRVLIIVVLYAVGFWAPWTWSTGRYSPHTTTSWLALSTTLARWGWLHLDQATLLVTGLAILFGFVGAALRVWGTAYLSAGVVHSGAMHGDRMMAAGPYRYVRNPLYLGSMFFGLSVAILMPPTGALVFLLLIAVFYFRLILGEENFLAGQIGEAYLEYRKRVPRLVPSLRVRIPGSAARPEWGTSLVAETLPVTYPVCLAALAWRYEPELLIRCLLICFGLSLVTRAFLPKKPAVA